jgi:hypothetical protein
MLTEEWPGSAPRGTAAESDVTPIEKLPGTAALKAPWRGAVSLGPADDGSGATNRGSEALTCP